MPLTQIIERSHLLKSSTILKNSDSKFKIVDESLYKYSDITEFTIAGNLTASASDSLVSGGGEFSGSISSQAHGVVGYSVAFNIKALNGNSTLNTRIIYNFPSFTAEGSILASEGQPTIYQMNGVVVTKVEFDKYFSSIFTSSSDEI